MAKARDNFIVVGRTDYPHEQAGLDYLRERLPESLHARALIDMFEPSSGRHYEIDVVVIGHGAVFVVEMKDYEGQIEGDENDWLLTRPGDRHPVVRDNPLALTNLKSKVLKGKLERYFKQHHPKLRVPFVQPLVFLTNERVVNKLAPRGRTAVVGRAGIIDALQQGSFPGANPHLLDRINGPTFSALKAALDGAGLKPRQTQLKVNSYLLGPVIADGPAYQDREAQHESLEWMRARARVYLVPLHTSVDERDRLRRAAKRESQLLFSVRDHEGILDVLDFAADAPLGPTLLFEDFAGGLPLDRFLERETPSFDERVDIFRQVGNALGYCHRREVVHGGLYPGAVLVRRHEDKLEVRLFNFQLGDGRGATATLHRTLLASESAQAYQAPELVRDPRRTSPASDCFSLGAIAYLLFTGQAPARDLSSLFERVQRERCLDPSGALDDLPDPIVETIRSATSLDDRMDDAVFIVENLISELRESSSAVEPESTAHVLEAEAGDSLIDRYLVTKVLGYGASARVLQIQDRDGREYALKIALDPEQNDRLEHEGAAIDKLGHPRIVRLIERHEFDGLVCLRLSLAGEHTLREQISSEGGLNYDMALRYGEDLLEALEHCEDKGQLHRDIKPANLGVGSLASKTKHLTLFDFSLAGVADDKLDIGTPPYRDPHLWAPGRMRWDSAADRWSAAITLHEMLTGVRPSVDDESEPSVAAERFDAALRDNLIGFFAKALAAELDQRFDSARAMKRAWSGCFDATRSLAPARSPASQPSTLPLEPASPLEPAEPILPDVPVMPDVSVTPEPIAKIQRRTPISALPLSPRALNALDRAGLIHAEELLTLPNNRLSAIRGIGTKVAHEILELRERWAAQLKDREGPEAPPFHPHYRGPELYLDGLGLPLALVTALDDAGVSTSGVLARTPAHQVEALLGRVGHEPSALRSTLAKLETAETDAPPANLEAWIDALGISSKRAADVRVRQLLGLEPPFLGRVDVTLRDLVEALGVTRQAIARNLADAIKHWRGQAWVGALRSLALQTVDGLAGVTPLPLAIQALRTLIPHDPAIAHELSAARCGALLRVAVELGADDRQRGLALHRRTRGPIGRDPSTVLWLVSRPDLWLNIDNLGRRADELAKRPVLAASSETERVLELVVQNTALSANELGLSRLVELAAWASHHAAASSRLELYPLGMAAARALELSAQALGNKPISADEVARRVHNRYPDAEPLPTRPALDALLEPLQLRWVDKPEGPEGAGSYERPQLHAPATSTLSRSLHREPTIVGDEPGPLAKPPRAGKLAPREDKLIAQEFEHDLRALVEDRKLRVFGVNAAYVPEALVGLERILDTRALVLDKRLIAGMDEYVRSLGGPPEILRSTDALGPEDPAWLNLQQVAKAAARKLAAELLPPSEPLLLIQLGLLARYDLREFLAALVDAAADERSHAIVLLNPIHEGERPELIANRLAIPGLLAGQIADIPREWIANIHRSDAKAS